MCIYTLKKFKKNFKYKNLQGGCAIPTNVPKLDLTGVKDTPKTNRD